MAIYVENNIVSSNLEVKSNTLYVRNGGVANSTTVDFNGYMRISSGGTANNTTINFSGGTYIYNGGIANNTTINGRGSVYISSGGTANDTTVNSWCSMYIYSGGMANGTILNSIGSMRIFSGGTANSTINNGGGMVIYTGGMANNTIVNSGGMSISSGGISDNTTVNSGGGMYIYSGGTANSTTVNSGGVMSIYAGGIANSTTVNSGYMNISSGGTATNVIWTPGVGHVEVAEGAYVTYVSDYRGVYFSENNLLSNSLAMTDKIVTYSRMYVMSGGTATNTTATSYGVMSIYAGGTANSATVDSWGKIYISSDGTANNIIVNFYGAMSIYAGGTANSTTVNSGGYMYISSGGTANSTTVNSSGYMYISSGGTATNVIWTPGVGHVEVADGAYVTYASDYRGVYFSDNNLLSNSLAMTDKIVANSRHMYVMSGGTATNTTASSYGVMSIYAGGTANSATVDSWGRMYISSDGTANNTIVNFYGAMVIRSGGTANSTIVKSDGGMEIRSGGTANSTIVKSDGRMYIYTGGTASRTTVNSMGLTFIDSGGTHRGTLQIESGAFVSAYEGSIIDFTVADRTKEDGYLINNLSLIQGAPTYTITVSDNQETGTYKLAQGASNFTGTISIGTENTTYGSITVNGADFVYNGGTYSLDQVNGNLTLSIICNDTTPPEKPTAIADITEKTSGAVLITATFSKDSAVKQYKINDGEWQDYTGAVTVTENATIYFRAADEAGNISDVTEYVVDNIIKSATLDGSGMTHAEAIAAGYELIVTTGGTYKSNFGHDGVEARIEGGTFSCTVSGGALSSSTNYKTWDDQENETNLTVTSGMFNKVVMGGDRVNYGNCEHVGDLHLTIEGGTFNSQIVGGMAYTAQSIHGQAILTGDVNMTLAGGTFKSRIYGGCISTANYSTRTAIDGNINIVVDSSENELIFEDNVYIVAGSYQSGAIDGNVQVTFTGLGKNLKMDADNLVWGGCSSDVYLINGDTRTFQSTISGSRTICFDDFTGEFNTGIRGFNIFTAENGSKLKILASNHLRDIEQWNLDWDTQLSGSFLNDFRGDTMNIDLTGWDQTATNLFDCAAVTFAGFESMKKVTLGGETAVYSEAISGYASTNYMLTLNDNQTMQLSMKTTIA